MDNIIIDERTGLHYELVGDYYLVAGNDETEQKSIGIWGQRHLKYIRQYKRSLYSELLTSGKLQGYLIDTNKQAEEMFSRWWQAQGLTVIPTISWSDEASFDWCFDGLPQGGDAAVSTVGILRQDDTRLLFEHGLHELIERKRPARILVYGQIDPEIGAVLLREGVAWRNFAHGQAVRIKWRDKRGR